VRTAKAATSQVPIVFLHVDDPVADGFVDSFAHPGGNLTGFAGHPALHNKRLEIFKEFVPGLHRLLVLLDPTDPATGRLRVVGQEAAAALRLHMVAREITEPADSERVFGALKPGEVDGVFVVSPSLEAKFPSLILRLASERHLPLPGALKKRVAQGALFYYGVNYHAVGEAAGQYVDKILKGTKPADLPVEYRRRFELILNLKTAQALGLMIPPTLLFQATEVIR
jgi:putative tryptophan/tyrosine transport system substrate-binding protein